MEVILITNYVSVRHGSRPILRSNDSIERRFRRSKLRQERLAFLETHLPGMKEAKDTFFPPRSHGELRSHLRGDETL